MVIWTRFAKMFWGNPNINWNWWSTFGTLGVVFGSLGGKLIELLRNRSPSPVDLGYRGVGALGWESARVRREFDRAGESALVHHQAEGLTWRMWGQTLPCPECHADFFDTVELDADHVAFFLGDVSGKGLPASLYQASCLALLRYASGSPGQAAAALEEVNSVLHQRQPDGRYATLLYGVLQTNTGKVSLVSAGHPDPVVVRSDGSVEDLELPRCHPLGLVAEPKYKAVELILQKGDRLLFCSDGVLAARDCQRGRFGRQRLLEVSRQAADGDSESVVETVMQAIAHFSYRTTDDRSAMALIYDGSPAEQEDE